MSFFSRFRWLITIVALFVLVPFMVSAIGLAPVEVVAENVLNDTKLTRIVRILRANPREDQRALFTVFGDAGRFIQLPNDGIVDLPRGQMQTEFSFIIAPKNLPKGRYETSLNMALIPLEFTSSSIQSLNDATQLSLGVQGKITFTVTNDEVEDFLIQNVSVPPVEESSPLSVLFQVVNRGNTEARPERVVVNIFKKDADELLAKIEYKKEDVEPVQPLSTQTVSVSSEHELKEGAYRAEVTILGKEEHILVDKSTHTFEVHKQGTLNQVIEVEGVYFEKNRIQMGEIALLNVRLKNSGDIPSHAKLIIEVRDSKERLVERKVSEKITLPPSQSYDSSSEFRFIQAGPLNVSIVVEYGVKKTDPIVRTLFVVGRVNWLIFFLVLSIIILCGVGVLVYKIFRKKVDKNSSKLTPRSSTRSSTKRSPKRSIRKVSAMDNDSLS